MNLFNTINNSNILEILKNKITMDYRNQFYSPACADFYLLNI